jgi:hypothetical protein
MAYTNSRTNEPEWTLDRPSFLKQKQLQILKSKYDRILSFSYTFFNKFEIS